jgi:predicted phosphodiesterase
MRIAIFADIHGNPFATRAVLDAIADDGVFDAVVTAGDLCAGGSEPAVCVDMLEAADVQAVYGNADEFVFASPEEPPAEAYRPDWDQTILICRWTAEKLGEKRLNWLKELPFELRFSPTGNVRDDLLVVHANPKDTYTHIFPPEQIQMNLFGEIRQSDNDLLLTDLFTGVEAAVMAFGHFHYTYERFISGIRLVNVSPCSFSRFDQDRRARYTIFTWNGEWQINRKYVEYDHCREEVARLARDMPHGESSTPPEAEQY